MNRIYVFLCGSCCDGDAHFVYVMACWKEKCDQYFAHTHTIMYDDVLTKCYEA